MATFEQLKTSIGTCKIQKHIHEYDIGSKERLELDKILKHKHTNPLSLISYSVDNLVEGAIRIGLEPLELDNESYCEEYNEKLAELRIDLYLNWKIDNPDQLKNALCNVSSSITYDLVDPESNAF